MQLPSAQPSGLSSRLSVLLLVLMLTASCSSLSPFSLLTGGGPNVAANTQVGAENVQGARQSGEGNVQGVAVSTAPSVSLSPNSRVDKIDQSVTKNVNLEPWMLLVMLMLAAGGAIGWVDNVVRLFKRK
mgnify:FL=1